MVRDDDRGLLRRGQGPVVPADLAMIRGAGVVRRSDVGDRAPALLPVAPEKTLRGLEVAGRVELVEAFQVADRAMIRLAAEEVAPVMGLGEPVAADVVLAALEERVFEAEDSGEEGQVLVVDLVLQILRPCRDEKFAAGLEDL
jgi:hypothetical protein